MKQEGDVKKFRKIFLTSPMAWVLAAFSRHFTATSTEISTKMKGKTDQDRIKNAGVPAMFEGL